MKFSLKPTDPTKLDVDVLLLFCAEGAASTLSVLGAEGAKRLLDASKREEFTGKRSQSLSFVPGIPSVYKVIVTGFGKEDMFTMPLLFDVIASAVAQVRKLQVVRIALAFPDSWWKKFPPAFLTQTAVEVVRLANYRFHKYKGEEQKTRTISDVILTVPPRMISEAERGLERGEIYAQATAFARDLVNEPAAVTTPEFLAETAKSIAKSGNGSIETTVLKKQEIAKLGMNAFLGVSQGSTKPPAFIVMRYKGKTRRKKIVLIGKGITFDTGGLSLKPPEHMETMKADMAGAASVLGVFHVLSKIQPAIEVVGIIAACENMPSGEAMRPGDIVRAMNGKTIEVLNTDAEGRLTLADAISYAKKIEEPDQIIDLATLTGACMVALGEEIAGLWSNNESLLKKLEEAATTSGERIWRMPLPDDYKALIKSHIADLKNIQTGRYGGAVTAALFVSEFATDTPWAHLDIAGPAYAEKSGLLTPKGGTGFGVRLLLSYLSGDL